MKNGITQSYQSGEYSLSKLMSYIDDENKNSVG